MSRKVLALALVGVFSLALAAPVSADGFRGGFHSGFHGGFHDGFHGRFHGRFHHGFHRFGCCFGPAFVGGVFLGSALAAPYYAYPYPYYPYVVDAGPVYVPAPSPAPGYTAPVAPPQVCYVGGCYHLQGDGVTTAYQWVWVPSTPAPPAGPPSR